MPKATGTTWSLLVKDEQLKKESQKRAKQAIEKSVSNKMVQVEINDGWTVVKEGKTKTKLKKEKPYFDAFEDQVWLIFYKMGFKVMNETNTFHLGYSDDNPDLTKQLDVIAIDDETCLFVECKCSNGEGKKKSWDKDIAEMDSLRPKLEKEIRKNYPGVKCKYIFATKGYSVGDMDRKRLSDAKIIYFDENTVLYYEKLVSYLGSAAKYQLLGSLFAGTSIKNMNATVPAIKGKMGKIDYYSFLIKPADLLKMGYVLHRTNANNDYEDLLPSYQRLIKKERLKKVREFINNGGYFPNSIVISIDTDKKKPLQFDLAEKSANEDSIAKLGTLHLPQKYQSAYIIDGQHRLYGYSESTYADNNTIPVIAFENLDKTSQLKLFMEINENQKAVPKALRNILEIDIYYDSENAKLRKNALLGKFAKRLGEDPHSPLCGRVIIGEDSQTKKCCITIEYIKVALEKTSFFNEYKNNGTVVTPGLFDQNDNDKTMEKVYPLLKNYFTQIAELCPDEWNNFITVNNFIVALIGILDDIVTIVIENDKDLVNDIDNLQTAMDDYVIALCTTLTTMTSEKINEISGFKGASAKESAYRTLQMELHENYSPFTNSNIEKYYIERYTNYANKSKEELEAIKNYLLTITKNTFEKDDWEIEHLSEEHHTDLMRRVVTKTTQNKHKKIDEPVTIWDVMGLEDFVKIVSYTTHWSDYYKDLLENIGYKDSKINFITLLKSLIKVENKISFGKSVTLNEYNQVKILGDLVKKGE